ncbi:MAG: hypothetical protein GY859_35150 [Desulfobacterales bacterium]|nr:hypothetical protein [Desulfobacterales bacterium]
MKRNVMGLTATLMFILFLTPFLTAENVGAKEATLRMLVWEGYAPDEFKEKFINLVKEKYGVDLKLEVKYVAGNDAVNDKLTPEEIAQFHLDDPTHFDKNRIPWKILGKKDRKGLKRLWDNALKAAK